MSYFRIMNQLDGKMLCEDVLNNIKNESVRNKLTERIFEITNTLDDNYGDDRNSDSMGGYILFFEETESYEKWIDNIFELYHISSNLAEYHDTIVTTEENETVWNEILFMLSSDDGLIIIYPEKRGENDGKI